MKRETTDCLLCIRFVLTTILGWLGEKNSGPGFFCFFFSFFFFFFLIIFFPFFFSPGAAQEGRRGGKIRENGTELEKGSFLSFPPLEIV